MIIFLYGPDTFRSFEKLTELRRKFEKDVDPRGDSIKVLDGEKLVMSEFSAATAPSSLFVKRRLVIVKNIFSNKNKETFEELSFYLKQRESKGEDGAASQNENIIIFIDDSSGDKLVKNPLRQFLLKQKFVQEFLKISLNSLDQWIIERGKEESIAILKDEASRIASLYGTDLWKIDSELKKLSNYKKALLGQQPDGAKLIIDKNDLVVLSPGTVNENIFAFTDAIGNKEKAKAIRFMETELEAGIAETQLLGMVIRQIKILIQLRQAIDLGYSQQKITAELKMHPYVMQKSLRQAKNFSLDLLKRIFGKLTALDKDLKTGNADFKLSLDLLIAEL